MTETQQNGPDPEYLARLPEIGELLHNVLIKYLIEGSFPENNTKKTYLEIYNFVSHYANKDEESQHLYEYFKKIINENANIFVEQLKKKANSEIIDAFIDISNRMDILCSFLTKTFSYVDFYYVKSKGCANLTKCALEIYKNTLFTPFQKTLTIEVNKLLKEDREGKKEHRVKIKRILLIMKFMDLVNPKIVKEKNAIIWNEANAEVKAEDIKTPIQDYWYDNFKQDTEQFVTTKAMKDIQNRSTPEYVVIELEFLKEEIERQNELINIIFHERLCTIVYQQIIGRNMKELVEMDSGVKNMLENNKLDDLSNLYDLFKNYEPSLHEIAKIFKKYILKRGTALRENKEIYKDPKKMVPELISLQREINTLVTKCFKNDSILQLAKDRAFFEFMKTDYYSKQVAYYLDFCMRAGFKGKDPGAIDEALNDIIGLFRNLNTKYIFQQETEKKMSDRLIKNATLSINNEKNFISKLKQESDISIVSKMVGMMSDLEKNKKEGEDYKNTNNKGTPYNIKFNVQVISNSGWEISNKNLIKIKLPRMFKSCVEDFEEYYFKKYPEQKLHWYFNFSKLEIQYLYLPNKNISVSTLPQILILLLLETYNQLSIKKIAEYLECDIDLVKQNAQGLVFNKTFNPKGQSNQGVIIPINPLESQEFSDKDEIQINKEFKILKQKFFTIPMPKKKTEEELQNEEKVSSEVYKKYQDHLIQSNLIRIMKSRIGQVTTHNWLVSQTIKQIDKLTAQPQMVKDNIEKLIEKNCIKRDENNKGCYEYVA